MLLFPTLSALNSNQATTANPFERALVFSPLQDLWAGNKAVIVSFILSGLVLVLPILRPGSRSSSASYYSSRLVRLYVPVIAAVILAFIEATVFVQQTWPRIGSWLALHAGDHPIGRAALDAAFDGATSTLNPRSGRSRSTCCSRCCSLCTCCWYDGLPSLAPSRSAAPHDGD